MSFSTSISGAQFVFFFYVAMYLTMKAVPLVAD